MPKSNGMNSEAQLVKAIIQLRYPTIEMADKHRKLSREDVKRDAEVSSLMAKVEKT